MSPHAVDFRSNAEEKSLDQLTFTVEEDGATKVVPALHKCWTTRENFATYLNLVTATGHMKTEADLEEWKFAAGCFTEDMQYLLELPHHQFWSYMVYQKSALSAIVSFLQHSTPFYLEVWINQVDDYVHELYENSLNLVVRIICRLITNKESPEAWLTKEHHRELIYKNYLISVPMLFDLLVAVGDADEQNLSVLQRIFEAVLLIEPNYKQDLLSALAFFRAAFRSIQTQTENEGFEGAGGGAIDESVETPYDDVALYTLDCSYSLSLLLKVCPEARSLCAEIKLAHNIAQFYDNTIPFLYKNIFLINENARSLSSLNQARLQFLNAFRSIAYTFVEKVLQKPEDSLIPSENLIALLTECLSEETFVIDYERAYPVELDVDILRQACKDLDEFKASFVVKGYQKEAESESFGTIGNIALVQAESGAKTESHTSSGNKDSATASLTNGEFNYHIVPTVKNRDIDLEVTAVLDVLPHLGTGFVRRVLSRYENSEEAIAAILEENLPPDLANADSSEVYIPPDPQDKLYQETGIKHFNAFDGDPYDIMTNDNPSCIIKQGKGFPNAPKNAAQLLDDKRDLEQVRHRYQEYTLVAEGGDSENDEYEDEYDDSYEALLESETRAVKSKTLQAGLANVDDVSDEESEDENEPEEENATNKGKRMDFCENPEVVRARYEARRQAKWGNREGTQHKSANVVGVAKGQGQDKDTLRNRDKKEKNKSSRANHNRKAGAAFKRSKGMMG